MRLLTPMVLGAALVVGCAAPALVAQQTYQDDQNRQANTQAYSAGYAQGQSDARGNAVRNDVATSQWVRDDDRRAYRQGYDAGFDNVMNRTAEAGTAAVVPPAAANLPPGGEQARQFGYEDGVAAGRHDQMKGDKFKPEDHDLYKNGLHGWTASLGTKDQFKQMYREAFVKGYQEGFRGTDPR